MTWNYPNVMFFRPEITSLSKLLEYFFLPLREKVIKLSIKKEDFSREKRKERLVLYHTYDIITEMPTIQMLQRNEQIGIIHGIPKGTSFLRLRRIYRYFDKNAFLFKTRRCTLLWRAWRGQKTKKMGEHVVAKWCYSNANPAEKSSWEY